MAEQKTNMTDEQLAQELRKSKGGKLGGKILSLLGGVIAVAGMILGGNLVLVVIGGVVLGLGQMVQGKSKEQAGRQTFDSIAPDIVGTAFENVQMNPVPPLLDANDTNIPLPSHTLALNTRYVFAGVPEWLDLRDIDGIRKWFTASLTGMGNLLDLITESPALTGGME